ncbi:MinD-like ATPase involved in chromosome partitioning or flagellar assembly [Natranaerovirga hydrolytica]|uniref:MinD-like ATPase involved in chromosome partitioning or flagellar assembly n=1 Tax=Natranaerovirga hydrolytica TaxID=680378 RepID=A0A4V2PZP5_9FIRM|nr:ATPase [Natranaerovirga hydrolytica]TCK90641.1 MinD-like ATPase involved in chromosome partitioning or flagellar assembly [Natranaerovirga hydrolytica]
MARKINKDAIDDIMKKISSRELVGSDIRTNKLIYSIIGFIPSSDFVENALLMTNLGYILSEKGLNTCIVDLKVFYPNIYHFFDIVPNNKGEGLLKVLKSDKVDFREEIQFTGYEKLYLLSPSPQDLFEEYYEFNFETIERLLMTLKNMFDIILLDIPNNPPLEFCLGAMNYCHTGFFTASEKIEASTNIIKLLDHAESVGISTSKFTSVILMNLLGSKFDYKVINELGLKIITALPFDKSASASALESKIYIKDSQLVNKKFKKEIYKLADLLADDSL